MSKVKKTMLLLVTVVCMWACIGITSWAATKSYTISSGYTTVYSNTGLTKKYGTIYPSDELTINGIWKDYMQVTYPISGGRTKTGYVATSQILTGTSGYNHYATTAIATYRRNSTSYRYGTIYKNDTVLKLGTRGSYTQVRYEVSGGYKFAFIKTTDANRYLTRNKSTPTVKTTTYYVKTTAGLILRSSKSTYASRLAVMPYGAAVSVRSISGNWAYVTYNGKTGYCSASYLTKTKPQNNTTTATSFQMPMDGAYCTWRSYSNWSWANNKNGSGTGRVYHLGIDIKGSNTNVKAAAAGTVAKCGWNSANGYYVVIKHTVSGKTVYSFYAHLKNYNVYTGKAVSKGQIIGTVGNTGSASQGTHLHFAITDTLWSGSYYGYANYFTGNKTTYGGVTYYNPVYLINYGKLP